MIINVSALGDLVSGWIIVEAAKRRFQQVDLVLREDLVDLVGPEDEVNVRPWQEAEQESYDWIIDLTSSSQTRRKIRSLNGRYRVGRVSGWGRWLKMRWVYNQLVPKEPFKNIVKDYYPLLNVLNSDSPKTPELKTLTNGSLPEQIENALKEGPTVGFHIGAGNPKRIVPEKLALEIIDYCWQQNWKVILLGTEKELIANMLSQSNGHAVSADLSLRQLRFLLPQLDLFIGPDSGPLHLASALKVHALGIYGPNLSSRSGPLGTQVHFVEKNFSCRPCNQNVPCPYQLRCLKQLPLERVVETIRLAVNKKT